MVKKKIEQQVTKWWHAFTELKSWVQIIIAVAVVVAAHNYILHQIMAKKKKNGWWFDHKTEKVA